jgi:hypothetical protein
MWLLPRVCVVTVLWKVIENGEYFQIQRYQSGGIFTLIQTARSLNPLDSNPQPFRIVLKATNQFLLVAVADTLDDIKAHWEKLENELLPTKDQIDDHETLIQFFCAKIGGWAALEEGEEGNNSKKVAHFHSLFETMVKDEKLLTYYDGAFWGNGTITPVAACLYITERSMCIDSSQKLVYAFKDITAITKDATLPFISNAILKFQTRQGGNFLFMLYKGASKAQETLETVWTANLNHWQSELANVSETHNQFSRKSDAASSSAPPASPGPGTVLASKNTALLKRANAMQAFTAKYLVPEEPIAEYTVSLCWLKERSPVILGTMTLTASFVCWSNSTLGGQHMKVVIATASILEMSVESSILGKGPNAYLVINTEDGNRFTFGTMNASGLMEDIKKMQERHKAYISRQREKWPSSSSFTLLRNGYQEDITRESNKDHQDTQFRLQAHWEGYFRTFGRGSSTIVVSEEISRLLKFGIPDIYRHELWPLLSGASHKLNANAGQYAEYLASENISSSQAAQDIDKDLHRSMPSHPYYASQPKNLEPLRNVLLAYAARNPAVGYCQGMNIVAAMLLLYLSEEVAFWVFTSIVEEIAPDYYNKQLFGSQVDQKVFNRLVKRKYPDLYQHLKKVGMPLHLLTLPWFMTFLIDCVPWEASLMVLDNLLYTGTSVLFQVALSMLTMTYESIMAEHTENEQIPLLIRAYPFEPFELMKMAFSKFEYIDAESVRRMRREGKAARLNDMQEAAHKQVLNKVRRKFKKTWKPEQIDEINTHYLNQGKGETLNFDAFKTILLLYAPFIDRNIIKPESSTTPTPDQRSNAAASSSASTTSTDFSSTPEPTSLTPKSASMSQLPPTALAGSVSESIAPLEAEIARPPSTPPMCLITPIETPSPVFSIDNSEENTLSPVAALNPAFEDEIIAKLWKSGFSTPTATGLDFNGLITIIDAILNQTPSQLFTWLLEILYPKVTGQTDVFKELDRIQFERLLLALYLINYQGEASITSNLARIRQFVPLVYEQMGDNATKLSKEAIVELVVNCELLDSFWSRLYYIDLGSSANALAPPSPMLKRPEEEGDDLIKFS